MLASRKLVLAARRPSRPRFTRPHRNQPTRRMLSERNGRRLISLPIFCYPSDRKIQPVNPSKQSAMEDSSAFLAATLPDLLQRVSRGRRQAEISWWNRQRLAPDFRSFSFFNTRETV